MRELLAKLEWLAGKLGYKTVWRFGLETAAVLFGLYALSVVLSIGWQSNAACEQFKPAIKQVFDCNEAGHSARVWVDCNRLSKFEPSNVSSSYWYEHPNGTDFNLPKTSLIGGVIK